MTIFLYRTPQTHRQIRDRGIPCVQEEDINKALIGLMVPPDDPRLLIVLFDDVKIDFRVAGALRANRADIMVIDAKSIHNINTRTA